MRPTTPRQRRLFVAGTACLALGTSMPLIVRLLHLQEGATDFLHGLFLGVGLALLIGAIWMFRKANAPAR